MNAWKKREWSRSGAGDPCGFTGKLRKTHDCILAEVDFQSLTVSARDFVNKSESKSPRHWITFLFSTDAFSMISEIKLIQIIDLPNSILSTVIKILRAIKRILAVTCYELGICIVLVLIVSCRSFVFFRLYSLFTYFVYHSFTRCIFRKQVVKTLRASNLHKV